MIPPAWRDGEVAVLGLARTGTAVSLFLADRGVRVYASDASTGEHIAAAAATLAARGIAIEQGRHDLERITRAVAVVVSPGVPPSAPAVLAARRAGVPVRAELDLAAAVLPATHLVVVTGTNGKSTTTALVAHILQQAGVRAEAAGNIGRPLIALAAESQAPTWAVVEASSYQLHDAPSLKPRIGVVTNLSPDHLDRYGSVEAYYDDKARLFDNADGESQWILNGDDAAVLELAGTAPGTRRLWRVRGRGPADAWWDRARDQLKLEARDLMRRGALALLGDHNVENALAAALVAECVGLDDTQIADGLSSFSGLAHRLEVVRDIEGVRWINDSKATNVASVSMAVRAIDGPFVLMMGGRHKGQPYTRLSEVLGGCRGVVAYGEAASIIAEDLGDVVSVRRVGTLAEAVHDTAEMVQTGDAALFSPACSSFDQFENFAVRGNAFRRLAEAL